MPSHQSTGASAEQATGTRDDTYDLVSVLYHALQGAETARHYIQDGRDRSAARTTLGGEFPTLALSIREVGS